MDNTIKDIKPVQTFSDKVRSLKVNQGFVIPEENRSSLYSSAILAFPSAKFSTQKREDGKVWLIRTA